MCPKMKLPEHVDRYLKGLMNLYRDITSIWLFGSRINGGATATSDWDFLIFANSVVHDNLKNDSSLPPKDISLMVVLDGDHFRSPWPRKKDGAYEKGSLLGWKWTTISDEEVKYEGCKELHDGTPRCRWEKAVRVFTS
jgi:hypothetical protein